MLLEIWGKISARAISYPLNLLLYTWWLLLLQPARALAPEEAALFSTYSSKLQIETSHKLQLQTGCVGRRTCSEWPCQGCHPRYTSTLIWQAHPSGSAASPGAAAAPRPLPRPSTRPGLWGRTGCVLSVLPGTASSAGELIACWYLIVGPNKSLEVHLTCMLQHNKLPCDWIQNAACVPLRWNTLLNHLPSVGFSKRHSLQIYCIPD